MTWTRLDDTWTDDTLLAGLSFADRWHYLAMIQFCSRTKKFDGVIREVDARRCSDHPDPSQAQQTLLDVGLLVTMGADFRLTQIDEHIPPPSVRENSEKSKVRMKRHRKHNNGDHSECLPEHCQAVTVTREVTRNTGTGQDGTGQLLPTEVNDIETTTTQGGGSNGKPSLEALAIFGNPNRHVS